MTAQPNRKKKRWVEKVTAPVTNYFSVPITYFIVSLIYMFLYIKALLEIAVSPVAPPCLLWCITEHLLFSPLPSTFPVIALALLHGVLFPAALAMLLQPAEPRQPLSGHSRQPHGFKFPFFIPEKLTLRVSSCRVALLTKGRGGKLASAQSEPWCWERLPPVPPLPVWSGTSVAIISLNVQLVLNWKY